MKKLYTLVFSLATIVAFIAIGIAPQNRLVAGAENDAQSPEQTAVKRTRDKIRMLDNIYKQTIVLITDKYVHDENDYPAGSAFVKLFANISKSGTHKVRLIDATGEPYEPGNVAKDEFEREAIKRLKSGAESHEQIVSDDGQHQLRMVTPVPVVMSKCIMCHDHYADAKDGEPIGAISYTVPIE